MKRVIIAPDSFKGSMSCTEVCRAVSLELKKRYDDIEITEIPVADGGEGTVDAFLHALGGEKIYCKVKSPLGRDITAYYALLTDGTAVIEMAQASGMFVEKKNNALLASTYGTGELIAHALEGGCRKFFIGIGGSATTDGGIGCVAALGGRFLDEGGDSVALCGKGLNNIHSIDLSGLDKRLLQCEIKVLCDVQNPLFGERGAAYIFGPQKGADEDEVKLLDEGLRRLAQATARCVGEDCSAFGGAGAAGGLGFALVAFCRANMVSGIDCMLEAARFCERAQNADLIITGEGKLDRQSLMGKVPFGVAEKSGGTRVIALVGVSEIGQGDAKGLGISEIIEANPEHLPFEEIKGNARAMLADACEKIRI